MNQSDFDTIVSRIPEMTKQQMTDLRRRLLFFMGTKDSSPDQDWLLQGILTVIRERGMGNMIPPNFRIKNTKSFGEYETQADRVRELLSNAIPDMTVVEQHAPGVFSARALPIFYFYRRKLAQYAVLCRTNSGSHRRFVSQLSSFWNIGVYN